MTEKQKPASQQPFGATGAVAIWLIRLFAAIVVGIAVLCLVTTFTGALPHDDKWGAWGVVAFFLSYGMACLSYLAGEYRRCRAKKAHRASGAMRDESANSGG